MDRKNLQSLLVPLLINAQLLSKEEALSYQQAAQELQLSFFNYLLKQADIPEKHLALLLSEQLHLPFLDLEKNPPKPDPKLESLPFYQKMLKDYRILPLYLNNNVLSLAIDDPSKQSFFKEIQFYEEFSLKVLIVESSKLEQLIQKKSFKPSGYLLQGLIENEKTSLAQREKFPAERIRFLSAKDNSLIQLLDELFAEAIEQKASDLHFEPLAQSYRIRFRQDGFLQEILHLPAHLGPQITARIKVLAHLDSAKQRLPQEGQCQIQHAKGCCDLRVSTWPSVYGEKVAIRLLKAPDEELRIESLGLNLQQEKRFRRALHKPEGLILVSGPTGSGKSITLYTALQYLNHPQRNILTIEDPVELKCSGLNQINIDRRHQLNFSALLKTALRQDPDVIMIGEIRDTETADIAIKAAQTGHLVLSTLHSKSAIAALLRLSQLGVSTAQLSNALSLIISQRLVRRLCPYCNQEDKAESLQKNSALLPISNSKRTCLYCRQGYEGRLALFEVLSWSETLKALLVKKSSSGVLQKQACKEGMMTLQECGLEKVSAGLTSLSELERVLG